MKEIHARQIRKCDFCGKEDLLKETKDSYDTFMDGDESAFEKAKNPRKSFEIRFCDTKIYSNSGLMAIDLCDEDCLLSWVTEKCTSKAFKKQNHYDDDSVPF